MLIRLRFVSALVTWCAFGIAAALIYSFYQLVAYTRDKSPDKKLGLSFSTLLHGPLAWPIMIPEAIEYLLAEMVCPPRVLPAPSLQKDVTPTV